MWKFSSDAKAAALPAGHLADRIGLTLAGVCVAALRRPPRLVVVEVITLLTVQTFGIMVANTSAMNLKRPEDVDQMGLEGNG